MIKWGDGVIGGRRSRRGCVHMSAPATFFPISRSQEREDASRKAARGSPLPTQLLLQPSHF